MKSTYFVSLEPNVEIQFKINFLLLMLYSKYLPTQIKFTIENQSKK